MLRGIVQEIPVGNLSLLAGDRRVEPVGDLEAVRQGVVVEVRIECVTEIRRRALRVGQIDRAINIAVVAPMPSPRVSRRRS